MERYFLGLIFPLITHMSCRPLDVPPSLEEYEEEGEIQLACYKVVCSLSP